MVGLEPHQVKPTGTIDKKNTSHRWCGGRQVGCLKTDSRAFLKGLFEIEWSAVDQFVTFNLVFSKYAGDFTFGIKFMTARSAFVVDVFASLDGSNSFGPLAWSNDHARCV